MQPCVRPLDAAHMTTGHNALRGSGRGQKHAFEKAMAQVGCPDRRIDRLCIMFALPTFTSRRMSDVICRSAFGQQLVQDFARYSPALRLGESELRAVSSVVLVGAVSSARRDLEPCVLSQGIRSLNQVRASRTHAHRGSCRRISLSEPACSWSATSGRKTNRIDWPLDHQHHPSRRQVRQLLYEPICIGSGNHLFEKARRSAPNA